MKVQLAEDLLTKVMEMETSEEFTSKIKHIQAMATYKYDAYQQFSPGMKFTESLALWLDQLSTKKEKEIAYNLIKNRLIFISELEMKHFIGIAYEDIIKPFLIQKVAQNEGIPEFKINKIVNSVEFDILKRKCLFLGLSDGAHLDFFRRTNRLNHEQVLLTYLVENEKLREMKKELIGDLKSKNSKIKNNDCKFDFVFLLDDFSGSSDTLLRKETNIKIGKLPQELKLPNNIEWGGKLWYKPGEKELIFKGEMEQVDYEKLKSLSPDKDYQNKIEQLFEDTKKCNKNNRKGKLGKILRKIRQLQENECLVSKEAKVIIILYVATQFAKETLEQRIVLYKENWWPKITVQVIQKIDNGYSVSESSDTNLQNLLESYYDESIMDKHLLKGGKDVIHGYNGCSLPLVIYHNTPNNSICLLWAKTRKITPLFQRVTRHKVE